MQTDILDDTQDDRADYSDDSSTFGDRLALAREAAGMSQKDLAHRLGTKLPTLRNWEEDRAEPRANKLQMLAGMLNVSMGWLMSGQGAAPVQTAEGGIQVALRACLADLRELRGDQIRAMDRTARLEKRLLSML